MFTIKLYNDENSYNVLCSPNYNIYRYSTDQGEIIEITLYKDYTTQNGVTYRIAKDLETPHWHYAFIENEKGKTIENIRPSF